MNDISYLRFDEICPSEFLQVLNSERVRKHLIEHEYFTLDSLTIWMNEKIKLDQTPGCRVRAVLLGDELIGWCAIQHDSGMYELAVIIDDKSWGLGKGIYQDLMGWARELNHKIVYINLLHTRPQYRFLSKLAKTVTETEMLGTKFTRYEILVQ